MDNVYTVLGVLALLIVALLVTRRPMPMFRPRQDRKSVDRPGHPPA
jgi:hypothetical protein